MDTTEISKLKALTNLFNQVNELHTQEQNLKRQLESCQRNLAAKQEEFDKAKKVCCVESWGEWRSTI